MTKISIIIPIYNVGDYLNRSLQSVLNQNYDNWECILINDGSTDKSREVCEEYVEIDERFILINQSNSGSGVARANGLSVATGEYICFIDPDDYISRKALKENIVIIRQENPDVIANGYYENKLDKTIKHKPFITGLLDQQTFRNRYIEYSQVGEKSLWNKLYNKEFLDKNNITFTSQRTGQDAVFNYAVYTKLSSIFITDDCYYNYDNTREGSAVNAYNPNRFEHEQNIVESFRNMVSHWSMEEKYSNNVLDKEWSVLLHEIRNINLPNNPFSFKEKKEKIGKLRDTKSYTHIDNELEFTMLSSKISKVTYFLFKNNLYSILILTIKLYYSFIK